MTPRILLVMLLAIPSIAQAQLVTQRVFVGNQGNFTDANGTVSMYDPAGDLATQDVIANLNTLVQSITIEGNVGYVMANTSDRIDVITLDTPAKTGEITNVASPRYLEVVREGIGYVSNLFSSTVTIVDLNAQAAGATIPVGSNPEDIAVVAGLAYVANSGFGGDSTLTVVDTATDMVVDTLDTGCDGPRFLEVDEENELWVFCNGNTVWNDDFTQIIEQTNGQIVVLDGETGEIRERFQPTAQLGAASAGQDAFYDPTSRKAFTLLGNNVLVFNTITNTQEPSIVIAGDEAITSIAYDGESGHLYLGRLTGFTTVGFVSIHNDQGIELSRFNAGVVPAHIALWQSGTPVQTEQEQPAVFELAPNYPNPFNPSTTFVFELAAASPIAIQVYSMLGQHVETIAEGVYQAGRHEILWQAGDLPSGTYLYRLTTQNQTQQRMMTLIK